MTARSPHDVAETVAAIRREVEHRGAAVVAVVDHAGAARKAGLSMPETMVVSFGDPRAGTPLMQAVPEVAMDLPLRIMVRDDGRPGSLMTWQDPAYVGQRYGLTGDQLKVLGTPAAIAEAVAGSA
ncbi:hypothetical protein GCM10023322_45020 [Rugosimonospora acidiphila]|uniref:DUF302 domain-containing protein n=1 Tax=Rugosimonospora acidiphila TaxID=556531 RepID=A0ABP9S3L3_9ACTN